jgi:cytochrome c551/c552
MTRISKLGLCSMVVGALALMGARAEAQAPPEMPMPLPMGDDSIGAKRGESLFLSKGCNTCHNISHTGKMSGPDLGGVVQMRDRDWLRQFLKNTDQMLQSDPIATAMLAKWKNVKMPQVKLSDAEVEALINYLETKTH